MPTLIELLGQQMGGSTTKTISKQIGADEEQTRAAIAAAVPSLMEALTRSASTSEGARQLHETVARDHDGGLLDNIDDYFGQEQPSTEAASSDSILNDILGPKQKQVESGVSKMSGLDAGAVAKLLAKLAPVLMGTIGRQQSQAKMDPAGLSKYLGQEREAIHKGNPKQASAIEKMLDQDGDGDFDAADMMRMGSSMAGQMFKK